MIIRKKQCIVCNRIFFLPNQICEEIICAKNLVTNLSEISHFTIINANKDNPIVRQQISCQHQPGINHAAPVGMKASVGIGIFEQTIFVLLPNAEIMIHQPLGGVNGQAEDIKIHAEWILKTREKLNRILAANSGQPLEKVEKDTDRDHFMSADEACTYGLIDKVITSKA